MTLGPIGPLEAQSPSETSAESSPEPDSDETDGDAGIVVVVEEDRADPVSPSLWRTTTNTKELRLTGGDLGEGLQSVPGSYVRASGGNGSRKVITLRGASEGQVLVLLDGVPLNPARGGGTDLSHLPAGLVDKLEVYRGGSATRFGSGAIGGAVNIVPDLPKEGLLLNAHSGVGSFSTLRGGAGVAGGSGGTRGLASVDWLTTSGDFEFLDAQGLLHTRTNADSKRLGGLAVGEISRGSVGVRIFDMAVLSSRGSPGPAEFQETFDDARLEDQANTLAARVTVHDLASTEQLALDGAATASWRHASSAYRNPSPYLISSVPFETTSTEDTANGSATLSLFSEQFSVHVGVDGGLARYRRAELETDGSESEATFRRRQAATASHVEYTPFETLSFLPAARLLWVDDVGAVVSPSLGVIVTPLTTLRLVGNIGRAWRAPSLAELYLRTEALQGDPDLKPEDALSMDFGPVFQPIDSLRLEASAFYLDIKDLILFLPVSASLYRAQNTGGARSYGLEVQVVATPIRRLSLDGSYTLTRTRLLVTPGDPLPGRPSHKGSATARLSVYPLEFFGRVTARSKLYLDNFGTLSNGPATFVDAGATVEIVPGFTVSLTARNLLDKRDAVDAIQYPLPGASFFAAISWTAPVASQSVTMEE